MNSYRSQAKRLLMEANQISLRLFKIMIPVILVVKVLKEIRAVEVLGAALTPVMELVGLPGGMGLVWATTMVTNLYGGMIVFFSLTAEIPVTIAQATVLTSMMLIAHNMPIELQIARKAGVRLIAMTTIRMAAAFAFGWLLCRIYALGDWLQGPNVLSWAPAAEDPSLLGWAFGQMKTLAMIYVVILALLFVLRAFERLGVTDLIERLLHPLLTLLGIGKSASTVTIIGMTLGLGYGGGLIIQEATSGRMEKRDVFFSLLLMGLCHSIVEDSLAMMLMGGHLSGILWGRLVFSLLVVFLAVRIVSVLPETVFDRYLFRSVPSDTSPSL